jgi:hypothetical protein
MKQVDCFQHLSREEERGLWLVQAQSLAAAVVHTEAAAFYKSQVLFASGWWYPAVAATPEGPPLGVAAGNGGTEEAVSGSPESCRSGAHQPAPTSPAVAAGMLDAVTVPSLAVGASPAQHERWIDESFSVPRKTCLKARPSGTGQPQAQVSGPKWWWSDLDGAEPEDTGGSGEEEEELPQQEQAQTSTVHRTLTGSGESPAQHTKPKGTRQGRKAKQRPVEANPFEGMGQEISVALHAALAAGAEQEAKLAEKERSGSSRAATVEVEQAEEELGSTLSFDPMGQPGAELGERCGHLGGSSAIAAAEPARQSVMPCCVRNLETGSKAATRGIRACVRPAELHGGGSGSLPEASTPGAEACLNAQPVVRIVPQWLRDTVF